MKIQPPNHWWDSGDPGRTGHRWQILLSRESIHSLSVYRWLSLEHKLMNIEPDVKDGAPDDAYSQTRNYGNTLLF